VHHIVDPRSPQDPIHARLERDPCDVVVFGHTHKPFHQKIGRTLFFNPGYAGRPRFNLERTAAIFHREGNDLQMEMLVL
jgi:predicted phosphodiesterase